MGGLATAIVLLEAGYFGRTIIEPHSKPNSPGIEKVLSDEKFEDVDIKKKDENIAVTAELEDLPGTYQEMIDQIYDLVASGAETARLYNITSSKLTIIISNPAHRVKMDGNEIDLTASSNELQATSFALQILSDDVRFNNSNNVSQVLPKIQQKKIAAHDARTGRGYGVYEFDLNKLIP